jgi:hypothetical protein
LGASLMGASVGSSFGISAGMALLLGNKTGSN